jgi:hypothetical protein
VTMWLPGWLPNGRLIQANPTQAANHFNAIIEEISYA